MFVIEKKKGIFVAFRQYNLLHNNIFFEWYAQDQLKVNILGKRISIDYRGNIIVCLQQGKVFLSLEYH